MIAESAIATVLAAASATAKPWEAAALHEAALAMALVNQWHQQHCGACVPGHTAPETFAAWQVYVRLYAMAYDAAHKAARVLSCGTGGTT